MAVQRDVNLHDLEDARPVPDGEAAARRRALAELVQLPHAPVRPDVAGRDDGDEKRDFREARDERLGEDVVALQLAVAPDFHRLADELLKADLQSFVEGLDPALETFGERLIVYVRVAYEEVVFKVWERGHLRLLRPSPRGGATARRRLDRFVTEDRKARGLLIYPCVRSFAKAAY